LKEYYGNYRGEVIDNKDPDKKGRVRIYVSGIYPAKFKDDPESLPWSEPVMPLFGGNFTSDGLTKESGVATVPHKGAFIWLFFERGDIQHPKHFGACQAGDGWISENTNQHVIQTDNVRIRVDEHPKGEESTAKANSYNDKCTITSQSPMKNNPGVKENQTIRVDVEIEHEEGIALNLKLKGDCNIYIEGDVYEHIEGNRHETLIGDLYRKHVGSTHHVQEGDIVFEHTGMSSTIHKGDQITVTNGNISDNITGNFSRITAKNNYGIGGDEDIVVSGEANHTYNMGLEETINIIKSTVINGTSLEQASNSIVKLSKQYNQSTKDGSSYTADNSGVTIKSKNVDVTSTGSLNMKGNTVGINSTTTMSLSAATTTNITSPSGVTIQGIVTTTI
jgi:hypothetical protein